MVNALTTEASVAGNAQNAAKAVVHAKTATVATAKALRVKTPVLQKHQRVWKPVQKRKPKCVPKHVPSAWHAKSAAKKLQPRATHALKAVANAVHAATTAVVSVQPVKKNNSMRKATCH